MSVSQDSVATIVCREVFDETSHPSKEEVVDYAIRLGIDPEKEPHLLELAREGVMAALPKGWSPCFHEASGAWYYFQASTGIATWEHPLDPVYRELVQQARASNKEKTPEKESKSAENDLESQGDATMSKESDALKQPVMTKIPVKLAPLKKIDKIESLRKKENSEKRLSRRDIDSKTDSSMSLTSDRASRDYTNLKFQDPQFYECPKLLDSNALKAAAAKKELDLKEVLKRSESLSPRHEKDWEQLSSKFSSEENIIDIDKLSASSLKSERHEKFDKEKHPSQLGQQKELTLSGGGSMFLKKNRSRDTTPSQDGAKLDDFRYQSTSDDATNAHGDRPKSILREKQAEDDVRPVDEERKSVRFDLEKKPEVQFSYSGADNESDSDTDTWERFGFKPISLHKPEDTLGHFLKTSKPEDDSSQSDAHKAGHGDATQTAAQKSTIIVGKRFHVQNVTENEHLNQQMVRDESRDELSADLPPTNKFGRIKNIDLLSKSETDSSLLNNVAEKPSSGNQQNDIDKHLNEDQRVEQEKVFAKDIVALSAKFQEEKEKMKEAHEEEMETLRKEFEVKLQQTKATLENDFARQKNILQEEMDRRLELFKMELAKKEQDEIHEFTIEWDMGHEERMKKVRADLEKCYEMERQDMQHYFKSKLDDRKKELLELRNQELGKLESEFVRHLGEEKLAKTNEYELTRQHNERIEALKEELEKELEELRAELQMKKREKIAKITEDHDKCMAEIVRHFKIDENLARKMYKQQLEDGRSGYTRAEVEKMRHEKNVLQEQYATLKEKYVKLKNDVRLAVERRSKRKEGYTTASETERSASTRTRTDKTESSEQNTPVRSARSDSIVNAKSPIKRSKSEQDRDSIDIQDLEVRKEALGFRKSVDAGDLRNTGKFESDDTTTASETNANTMKKKKSFSKRTPSAAKLNNAAASSSNNNNVENPVENIRKQLEKLEEIGDQLPSNEMAYTLRYPFQDKAPANVSSELEFFRHRIHVERDSVRRAREALRQQRSALQGRQKAWKQRSARATLEQLVQEERELSDMEISLHRTRSLLGEKVIHLRHLEQSLERMASVKKTENDTSTKNDELTLSDMSSASSGFSSTDLATDTFADKSDHYQESTEIIANLENLNSEIREIWGVLNKRQGNNTPSPPTLMYSYLRWLRFHHLTTQPTNVQASFGTPNIQSNILSQLSATQPPTTQPTTQNIIAQYGPNSRFSTSVGTVERNASNLMERTRNLRDWLRQARIESADLVSPGQATL